MSDVLPRSGHSSFIYFLMYSDGQRVKIGSTGPRAGSHARPDLRFKEQDDGGLEIVALVPGTEEQEHGLHDHFDAQRQVGRKEQFWYADELRTFVDWVAGQRWSAKSLDPVELDGSWAPHDWLPWMQAKPREESSGQVLLPYVGFHWARQGDDKTSDEYYTRECDIAPARLLLGGFDLDPASHPNANVQVGATHFLTINDDALTLRWEARRVWMNPPYSLSNSFTSKLIRHHEAGDIGEAVAFLSARSVGDNWWHDAGVMRYPVCFRRGRAKFDGISGKGEAAQFGHLWVYLGHRAAEFERIFSPLGTIVRKVEP